MQSGHAGNDHIIPAGTIGTFSMYTVLYRWTAQAESPEARISETNLSGTGLFLPGSTVFARSKKAGEEISGNRWKPENTVIPDMGGTVVGNGVRADKAYQRSMNGVLYIKIFFANAMRFQYVPERYTPFFCSRPDDTSIRWLCS